MVQTAPHIPALPNLASSSSAGIPAVGIGLSLLLHGAVVGALLYAAVSHPRSTESVITPMVVELVTLDVIAGPPPAAAEETQAATRAPAPPQEVPPPVDAVPLDPPSSAEMLPEDTVEPGDPPDELLETAPQIEQERAAVFLAPRPRRRPVTPPRPAVAAAEPRAEARSTPTQTAITQTTVSEVSRSAANSAANKSGTETSHLTDGQAGDGSAKLIKADYLTALSAALAQARRYPRAARRRGLTGTGVLRLTVSRSGALASWQLERSTGHRLLDEEIAALLGRAAPFPAFPEGMTGDSITLRVPVAFMLR